MTTAGEYASPATVAALQQVLARRQRSNGAFLSEPRVAAVLPGSWAAHALDLVGETERAARFHAWATNLVHRARAPILHGKAALLAGRPVPAAAWLPYGQRAPSHAATGRPTASADAAAGAAAGDAPATLSTFVLADVTASWAVWLWVLSQHHQRRARSSLPLRQASVARIVGDAIVTLCEQGERGLLSLEGSQATAYFAGLNALHPWLVVPDLDQHLTFLWRLVDESLRSLQTGQPLPQPAREGLSLLGAGWPFDVVDGRSEEYGRLLDAYGTGQERPAWERAWLAWAYAGRRQVDTARLRLASLTSESNPAKEASRPPDGARLTTAALTLLALYEARFAAPGR